MAAIEIDGLTKRFGDVVAVDGLDLTVEEGEIVGFLGPNGADKSTTIDILLDFIRPTEGTIAAIPVLSVIIGFGLFAAVPAGPGGFHGGIELVLIFGMMLPMLLLWVVGLSAAGGYVGAYLHVESR